MLLNKEEQSFNPFLSWSTPYNWNVLDKTCPMCWFVLWTTSPAVTGIKDWACYIVCIIELCDPLVYCQINQAVNLSACKLIASLLF